MARKKSQPSFGPSQAYIVSFGDMMTALLAFFIVLCSLAEEQTGANLHSGTGSFVQALNGFGLPGAFRSDTSKRAVSLKEPSPLYIVDSDDSKTENNPIGSDDSDNGLRVIDREQEEVQRFVNEMKRLSDVAKLPGIQGEVTFDFFDKLNPAGPLLPKKFDKVIAQLLPLFQRRDYQIEVVVWATTPSQSAWSRAIGQSRAIAREIAAKCRLSSSQRSHLSSQGRPWLYSDVKRPVFSILVRRLSTS